MEAKKAKEREQKREAERKEREDEIRRRELTLSLVKGELEDRKACDLFAVAKQVGGDVDEEWVEKILNAGGVIGRKGDVITMVTSMGWAVRVSASDMAALYRKVLEEDKSSEDGTVSYDALGGALQSILQQASVT